MKSLAPRMPSCLRFTSGGERKSVSSSGSSVPCRLEPGVGSPFSGTLVYDASESPAIGPVHNGGPSGGSDQAWFHFTAYRFTVTGNGNPYTFGFGSAAPFCRT
jgi:hypothetical protein